MKKIIKVVLSILLICSISSCDNKVYDYSEYETLINFDDPGLWIICWRINEYEWRCGVRIIYNRKPDYEELLYMQTKAPCKLSKMKEMLSKMEKKQYIDVVEVPYPMNIYTYWKYEYNYHFPHERDIEFTTYLYLYSQLGLPIDYDYLEELQNKLINESEK